MHHDSVTVIIPALNEEKSIGKVLRALPRSSFRQAIVVDNGSTDRTAKVAAECGAIVISEPRRGYGRACLTGIAAAEKYSPAVIVFLDGDFSDFPEQIVELTQPVLNDDADMVIGSRSRGQFEQGALLPQARFGNWLASRLIYYFWHFQYSDLGPFRAIRRESLMKLNMLDTNYGWTVEMQIKALIAGLRVMEIPVSYRKRIGASKVSGTLAGSFRAGYKILWTIFKYGFLRKSTDFSPSLNRI